eukprot:TRINITY_DN4908_c0_g4_i1.p1 TRINITY_DN4908_c0_g4~~TRINITY_DN4908_c0_g4_i1.p1  ORF type:complete len:504 (-),score=112.68 TRINITY_DN4908_c0_g4_i1:1180-2691(-)
MFVEEVKIQYRQLRTFIDNEVTQFCQHFYGASSKFPHILKRGTEGKETEKLRELRKRLQELYDSFQNNLAVLVYAESEQSDLRVEDQLKEEKELKEIFRTVRTQLSSSSASFSIGQIKEFYGTISFLKDMESLVELALFLEENLLHRVVDTLIENQKTHQEKISFYTSMYNFFDWPLIWSCLKAVEQLKKGVKKEFKKVRAGPNSKQQPSGLKLFHENEFLFLLSILQQVKFSLFNHQYIRKLGSGTPRQEFQKVELQPLKTTLPFLIQITLKNSGSETSEFFEQPSGMEIELAEQGRNFLLDIPPLTQPTSTGSTGPTGSTATNTNSTVTVTHLLTSTATTTSTTTVTTPSETTPQVKPTPAVISVNNEKDATMLEDHSLLQQPQPEVPEREKILEKVVSSFRSCLCLFDLTLLAVPGDGNCFYRAVVKYFLPNVPHDYEDTISLTLRELLNKNDANDPFKEFYINNENDASTMRNAGVWADHIQIKKASNFLDIPVLFDQI